MITSFSAPLFGAGKRQHTTSETLSTRRPRHEASGVDVPMTDAMSPLSQDAFQLQSVRLGTEIDSDNEVDPSAALPEVGNLFQSRSQGNWRKQSTLLSEEELHRDLERHTAFKTYNGLELLLDVAHPLEPDDKSKNPAIDRASALIALRAKVDNPAHRLSASNKRYLTSVGLSDKYGRISQATRYDVNKLLKVSPKSQKITLIKPQRSEATTYWQKPLQ